MNKQRQELIQTLYTALKKGEILKGDQLFPERELTELFNVKRSLLREALIALDTLGVIEIRERQGMFICDSAAKSLASGLEFLSSFSPIEIINQTFEVRLMIETDAAALAAERRTEHTCSLLRIETEFFEKLSLSNHPSRPSLAYQHNVILHNIIMDSCNNQVLREVFNGVLSLHRNAFSVLGSSSLNYHPYAIWYDIFKQEHEAIIDAIIEGNSDAARKAMETHLKNAKLRNRETLSKEPLILIDIPGMK